MKLAQRIKNWITETVGRAGIAIIKQRSPILKEVFDNPENLKIEAHFERDEIVVKIKKSED